MQGSSSNIILKIIDSKLFACEKMWRGIEMDDNTSIITRSSTIEDARRVINCIDKSYVIFDLRSTVFNRNNRNICIENTNGSMAHAPFFKAFQNNTFSCTSLTNSGVITQNGILAINYDLILPNKGGKNTFKGIEDGIELNDSRLVTSNLIFDDMIHAGIVSTDGRMELKNCNFLNYRQDGVIALKMQKITFDNCVFIINDNVKSLGFIVRGISVLGDTEFGSLFSFTNSKFQTNLTKDDNLLKFHRNIVLSTPVVNAGTEIFINNSEFSTNENVLTHGIALDGYYPEDSKISIFKNEFSVKLFDIFNPNIFLLMINGNKENSYIVGNKISGMGEGFGLGFGLVGSEGKNNFFAENKTGNGPLQGGSIQDFKNTLFCSNAHDDSNTFMFFTTGLDNNTKLIANIATNSGLFGISDGSFIGAHTHNGNQWRCPSCNISDNVVDNGNTNINVVKMSTFIVHTEQSTEDREFDATGNLNIGFRPFYPLNIAPFANDVWWFTKPGTPKSTCLTGLVGTEDDETNRFIASGDYRKSVNNDALAFQVERTLYFNLMDDNELIGKNPIYTTFIQKMEKTNIPSLYEVSSSIRNARKISDISMSNLNTINKNISDKISLLENLDNDLNGDISSENIEEILLQKKGIIEEIGEDEKKLLELHNELHNQMSVKLNGVTEVNKSIATSNIPEINEQVFNHYYIKVLRGGELTDIEKNELKEIAFQCPKDGGMAVYYSRSLLDNCIKKGITDFYDGCYSRPTFVENIVVPTEIGTLSKTQKNTINELFPNPASEFLNAKFDSSEEGIIVITNLLGKEVLRQHIKTGDAIDIHKLNDGVYHAKIVVNGLEIIAKKIIIAK